MKIVPLKAWLQLLDKAKNEKLAQMRPNLTMHFEASRLILKSIHTHTHTHTWNSFNDHTAQRHCACHGGYLYINSQGT